MMFFRKVREFSVPLILYFIHLTDQFPLQDNNSLFNFEDEWDYNVEPHRTPLINGSQLHYSLPSGHDAYAKSFKIEETERKSLNNRFNESKLTGDVIRSRVPCHVCKLGVGLLVVNVKSGVEFNDLKQKFVSLCVLFKVENFDVCSGIFDTYGPEIIPALEVTTLNPKDICKLLLGEACENPNVLSHQWDVELPNIAKPGLVTNEKQANPDTPVFKVLHISDTHYDPDYAEGSPSNCEEPLCCRTYSTARKREPTIPAGRWGSYEKCDAPKNLLENMFHHIALEHPDIDYIIWTGDLPPHDIWNQTKKFNLDVIKDTVEMIFNAFPDKPIFPAIGNHESSPAGNFAPPWVTDESHSISWLYNEMAKHWSRWLPASAGNTVYHGAFYSVLLRPGFRLISMNTNYCHSLSWWLYINSTDPASELKWLIHELQEAENNGEKVHIIGHIAPGSSDCMKTWSKNFYKIVNRYESTITGLFYGHSHYDEFEVFYEPPTYNRATAVAYLGPSATTFTNNNPAYRIYYIDGDHEETTREVIDHETWTFDLEEANESADNKPNWYKLYSAKDSYQMATLRPAEWDKLIKAMQIDEALFDQFHRNYHRNSPKAPWCNKSCRIQILCDLMSAESHNRHEICKGLERIVTPEVLKIE